MNDRMNRCIGGWMNRWMDDWINRWIEIVFIVDKYHNLPIIHL